MCAIGFSYTHAGEAPLSASSIGKVCLLPGCTRPQYVDETGKVLDYCGRTHAALAKVERQEPRNNDGTYFCGNACVHYSSAIVSWHGTKTFMHPCICTNLSENAYVQYCTG